jgi:hypothetical protein
MARLTSHRPMLVPITASNRRRRNDQLLHGGALR